MIRNNFKPFKFCCFNILKYPCSYMFSTEKNLLIYNNSFLNMRYIQRWHISKTFKKITGVGRQLEIYKVTQKRENKNNHWKGCHREGRQKSEMYIFIMHFLRIPSEKAKYLTKMRTEVPVLHQCLGSKA